MLEMTKLRLLKIHNLRLEKLIVLNLSNCEYLVETPDFSRVPSLERLILEGCKRLSKIHPTIEKLKQVMLLNLKGCESLDSLPQGICFNFLETFILSGCTKLDRFPEIVGDTSHLSQLYLDGTAIKELPTSAERLSSLILLDLRECKNLLSLPDFICSFTSLENLNISGCSLIDQLPENIGSLEKLEKLDACRTAIRKAPSSIVQSNISFQLPESFSSLSSLTCLSLAECNLEEGAIPEDIGCLTLLERLELSGNNFMSLSDSISQLSNLRRFSVDNCRKLGSLPKLPLNVKHVQANDCPILNDHMTIWPSDEGFSFIDCRNSVKAEGCLTHHPLPMPEEHIATLFPKFIKDQIYHGGNLELRFPCARIPDWCIHMSSGSSKRIRLPEKDSNETWLGFALFIVFLIKKQENFHDGRYNTFCKFYTGEGCLQNPLEIESFNGFKVGSYGLCVYVPKTRFGNQLDRASHIEASISTDRSDVEVLECGLHVIFNKDVAKFTQDLVDTSNEHLNLTSIKHYKHILEKASELERSGDIHELQHDSSPRKQVFGTLHPTSQLRIDLNALLSRIFFEGSLYTRNLPIPFSFPIVGFVSGWFFHQSAGCNVVCYLPANILDDKSWIGLSLYATLKMSPSDSLKNYSDSKIAPPLLHIDLHSHGSSISHIKTLDNLPIMPHSQQPFLFHVPRVYFEEHQLNRCWGISVLFRTSIPNVEVERCGIRAIYEKDLGNVIEMINECQLGCADDEQLCYQAYEMLVESIIDTFQFVKPETKEQEMPIHSSYSSQSAQHVDKEVSTAYEQITIPRDPIVVHSKRKFMESSYKLFEERSSGDSKLGLIHLQIMAETPLFVNDLARWKEILRICLNSTSVGIGLPPDLKTDKDWRGIAICVAFSVQEHPNAIIDDENLHVAFRLLCHLSTDQACCLNPAPSYIAVDIYNECPGLVTENLGVRLLFKQDVEEFTKSITKCMTGFFDNLDPICQFMANESAQETHSHVDHELGSKSSTGNNNWYASSQPGNMTTEPTFPEKMGIAEIIVLRDSFLLNVAGEAATNLTFTL
ncbi:hypothetical protein FEM48_Zijuj10G0167300 [Ziziphus jujuba var. spinosa]|uniref:Disease resistance-like protein DSC1 n=1 Tax=Ziziphus jujuba var. spinosa TaxID=714518 RepID=A0A978UPJ1_ZIZJJ|nr:hypothetical protein FEM48_Zijuj10G0167300 [Ziziphus jujuba var. spinosa]